MTSHISTKPDQIAALLSRPAFLALALVGIGVVAGAGGFGLGLALRPPPQPQNQVRTVGIGAAIGPGFADLAAKVKPAVVTITAQSGPSRAALQAQADMLDQLPQGLRDFFADGVSAPERRISAGSGFIISADGYVVTNGHVVGDGGDIEITTDAGKTFRGTVVGIDRRTDIALLRIAGRGLPYVHLGTSAPRVGEWVLAVGDPFGLGGTVTAGIISGRGRDIGAGPYDDFLQIDAPINHGNSGGPAFNLSGDVVGMNTAILSPSGGSIGLGFAIPAPLIERVVKDLKANGVVARGWLGVSAQPVTSDFARAVGLASTGGAVIDDAAAEGPADGKLRPGDIVTQIDGAAVADPHDLARVVGAHRPGETVTVDLLRAGHRVRQSIQLGALPADPA
jgi:serine protease Do